MKLLNCRQLAEEIGRSPGWVSAAKRAGMPFFCGRTTFARAVRWMEENPHFKVTQVYRSAAKAKSLRNVLDVQSAKEAAC